MRKMGHKIFNNIFSTGKEIKSTVSKWNQESESYNIKHEGYWRLQR